MTIMNISGYKVMLDDEDAERVSKLSWCVCRGVRQESSGLYYFGHTINYYKSDGRHSTHLVRLHRFLIGCIPGDGKTVDHIDGNTLNCQKSNLRVCSQAENKRNRKIYKNNTSGYKGVSWNKKIEKWVTHIRIDRISVHLGCFDDPVSAYEAYKKAALKYHGEYARFE